MREAVGYACARIVERRVENPKTISLVLDQGLGCRPGQFTMVWLPGLDEKPFSISGGDPLQLTIAKVGPFSDALHRLRVGDRLWFRGPFGKGFSTRASRPLLIGGGYGAAPLFYLATGLISEGTRPAEVKVALGARTASDLLFVQRFTSAGTQVLLSTDDATAGRGGVVTAVFEQLLQDGAVPDRVYACGPEKMLEAIGSLCRASGIPGELSFEAYMRCGIGLCGACEMHGGARLVCLDGPVFDV